MTDADWCIPPSGHLKTSYTIMTNTNWYIPPSGTFNNVIHHHDGCQLVHPAMWDIEQFQFAFMTDVAWCILPFGHSVYRFSSRCQELTNSFIIQLITHVQLIVKHFKYHIFKSICTFVITFQRYAYSIQSFQIYLVNYQNT